MGGCVMNDPYLRLDEVLVVKDDVNDIYALRDDMYRNGYIMYNRHDSDGSYCFVKESVLIEYVSVLWEHMRVENVMDHEEVTKLECLLRDPLRYEWKWKNFSNRGEW